MGSLTSVELAAAVAVTLLASFVKGAVGFAMPMVMVSGLALFLPAPLALAMLIVPTLASNLWQALRQGRAAAWASLQPFRLYLAVLVLAIMATAQLVTWLPEDALYLMLGAPITVLALIQLAGVRFRVRPGQRRRADLGVGLLAGGMGGLSGVWGPQTVLYLTALDVPKGESVRVQGVIYGVGGVALLLAHLKSGVMNAQTVPLSVLMTLPALAGMALGFRVQDRLDQDRFRRWTLIVLVLAGLNLIRKGAAGLI